MPITKTTTDYTGRKKDISILQYPDATKTGAQDVAPKFGKNTRFCAGPQKLIQQYMIVLLSNMGSQSSYPGFGTNFLSTLQAGISPTDKLRATQIFQIANYKAVNTIKAYQTYVDLPSDERLRGTKLTNITLYGGYVSFDVSLTTEAGDNIPFLVPLPVK